MNRSHTTQSPEETPIVSVEGLVKTFTDAAGAYPVLRGASFLIKRGEMAALSGVSGAGKTTLLQILGGLDTATSGSVVINGKEIGTLSSRALASFRNEFIGFVFQFHHLLPEFTAEENVCIPGMIQGKKKDACMHRARELLLLMGLDRQAVHYPAELSGGERQRVALARALFNEPALVLADEPTGNLDSQNSRMLLDMFERANRELRQTFLIATHNKELARSMHRVVHIEDGIIETRLQNETVGTAD